MSEADHSPSCNIYFYYPYTPAWQGAMVEEQFYTLHLLSFLYCYITYCRRKSYLCL